MSSRVGSVHNGAKDSRMRTEKSISWDAVRSPTKYHNALVSAEVVSWDKISPPGSENQQIPWILPRCGQWKEAASSWCNLFSSCSLFHMYGCQNPARIPTGNVRAEEFARFISVSGPCFVRHQLQDTLHIVNTGLMKIKVMTLLHCSTRHDTWA
jgi:hypothetical protein